MKKLLMLLTFLSVGVFVSCSKDNAAGEGDSISIAADVATRYTGESFTFTVTSKDGSDVTSDATILVNDVAITGKEFISDEIGTFKAKAIYSGMESKVIDVTVTENPVPVTAISTAPSTSSALVGDQVTFKVTGDNSSNVTSKAIIYVNGVAITGTTYTPTATGTVEVYSTYVKDGVTFTSPTVEITVVEPTNFNKRVLIEDFTGTWCGYCPRIAYAIEKVFTQTDDAVAVAIHGGGNDPWKLTAGSTLQQSLGITGYPTGKIDRKTTWKYSEPENVNQVVDIAKNSSSRLGLAMNTSITGSEATVTVKVKFGQNFSDLKLVVYALEDKLINNQTNYTEYYGGTSVIKDFEFNDVLRASLTNILGDAIDGSTNVNDVYSKELKYTIPANVKAENLHFVAFVIDANKKAINVRKASNNATQDFEIE